MSKLIHVRHMGNIGNRMFQYMFARHLQAKVPGSQVIGFNIPGWDIACNYNFEPGVSTLFVDGNHKFNVEHIAYLLKSNIFSDATLRVFAQRMEYLPPVDVAREWFNKKTSGVIGGRRNELLVNIRGAEILSALHKDYMPLSLNYYQKLISHSGLTPVFMGQIDDGPYGKALKNQFKGERFLSSISPLIDFSMILHSINIACSISSFSWLAAWMSIEAETIHLPLAGFLNPNQRPDIDLVPLGDSRFSFYKFPIMRWEAKDDQVADIIEGVHEFLPFDISDIKACIREYNNQY